MSFLRSFGSEGNEGGGSELGAKAPGTMCGCVCARAREAWGVCSLVLSSRMWSAEPLDGNSADGERSDVRRASMSSMPSSHETMGRPMRHYQGPWDISWRGDYQAGRRRFSVARATDRHLNLTRSSSQSPVPTPCLAGPDYTRLWEGGKRR